MNLVQELGPLAYIIVENIRSFGMRYQTAVDGGNVRVTVGIRFGSNFLSRVRVDGSPRAMVRNILSGQETTRYEKETDQGDHNDQEHRKTVGESRPHCR